MPREYRGYSPRRSYSPERGRGSYGRPSRREERTSLLVRNIPRSALPDDLRAIFEEFGHIKDVYLPKDFYSGEPRGFGFVQFIDSEEASNAQYQLDRTVFQGREISVVFAEENRKRPQDMRGRERQSSRRGGYNDNPGFSRRHSPYYSRSRSRSPPRRYSPSPPRRSRFPREEAPYEGPPRSRDFPPPSGGRLPSRSPPPRSSPPGRRGPSFSYFPPARPQGRAVFQGGRSPPRDYSPGPPHGRSPGPSRGRSPGPPPGNRSPLPHQSSSPAPLDAPY